MRQPCSQLGAIESAPPEIICILNGWVGVASEYSGGGTHCGGGWDERIFYPKGPLSSPLSTCRMAATSHPHQVSTTKVRCLLV